MRYGVFTFFTDEGTSPVDLGKALEERGFGSLFATEHSHIPVDTQTPYPYPMGAPIPPQHYRTLDPFVSLTAAAVATDSLSWAQESHWWPRNSAHHRARRWLDGHQFVSRGFVR